uniref:Chromosome 19 open reading frame 12 n=1 Tax=Sinocyclocheilus anshuiensis TaxID=1608454 RepID=A0A671QDN4_9TELE
MLRQIDDVMALCCKVSENSQIEVAVNNSRKGAAAAGGGAFLGGQLGGPPGIFIGTAVGWWMTRGKFCPLHQMIMEMSPQQREKLYSELMEELGILAWDNLSELILSVMSNSSLKMQVLDILKYFARQQLRAKVKYGKKIASYNFTWGLFHKTSLPNKPGLFQLV